MLLRLCSLLDNLSRHPHRASRDLSQACCGHVCPCLAIAAALCVWSKISLGRLVGYEEQCGAWRGAYYRRSNAIVDAAKASGCPEARGGLEAGFEGVKGEERGVDCGACYGACLDTLARALVWYEVEIHTSNDRRYGDSTRAFGLETCSSITWPQYSSNTLLSQIFLMHTQKRIDVVTRARF